MFYGFAKEESKAICQQRIKKISQLMRKDWFDAEI